jgi:hypothetical protein
MATLLIAIPGLLLGLIPMICGAVAVCFLIAVAYVVIKRILNALALFFETLFKPKLVYVRMSDDDIKIKYHELDNKEHGYNPLRQDFASLELFPQIPIISQIKVDAQKLFPRVDFNFIQAIDVYRIAHTYFLRMLVERATMIDKGLWTSELENQWVNFKGRPKQMLEIDSHYMDWHYKQLGQENLVATRLVS